MKELKPLERRSPMELLKIFLVIYVCFVAIILLVFKIMNKMYIDITAINIVQINSIYLLICTFLIFTLSFSVYIRKKDMHKLKLAGAIFQNAKEAIIITDKDSKIIYANKSFEEVTGYKAHEAINKTPGSFKSGIHDKTFYENMWNSIKTLGRWQGEVWDKRKNGEIYPKFLTITALGYEKGEEVKYIGVFQDITDIKKKDEYIDKLKNYDMLTGLPNQKSLHKMVKKHISLNDGVKNATFLISIIISNYSSISTSFGYGAGEVIILEIVKRIENILDGGCTLFKLSKEELMILCTEFDSEERIHNFLNILTDILKGSYVYEGENIFIKGAIGVSILSSDSEMQDRIIENTNMARDYAAKQDNFKYQFYSEELRKKYIYEMKLENDLREAIEKNEIKINYQPQVDVDTGRIIGAEALIRWINEELGFISPDKFIPIAEKTGLIISIGKWVLEEVCKQNKLWQQNGLPKIPIAVNLSPSQFKNHDIINDVKQALDLSGLEGRYLSLEITEGIVVENTEDISNKLNELKNMDITIAIDDFGTGYSSLGYLRRLKFDKIKIDREFIKDYPDSDNGAIARIIVNLSHELEIEVIAEGVETEEQIDFIKKINCEQVQGYYYSPPLSPDRFEKFIKDMII